MIRLSFSSFADAITRPGFLAAAVRKRVFLLTEGLKRVRRVEEVGRPLTARDDVVNRNRSGQALRVGDQPLLQLQLWPAVEHELDRAGRVAGFVLERDRKRSLIALNS